jgi:Fic family protein
LYLSLYFKQNRPAYYELLDRVRREGDWEEWLAFFLEGVKQVAEGAMSTAEKLGELFRADRGRVEATGRKAGSALRVHEALKARPIESLSRIRHATGLSFPTVAAAMELLVDLGIARELTGQRRNRLFAYGRYLAILDEGTEPLQ